MSQIVLFNKPFQVMSQFSNAENRATLKDFLPNLYGFYPAGRLDYDSEGLMILTNDGQAQHKITDPKHKLPKTYWVQVEQIPCEEDLERLRAGVALNDGPTKPAKVRLMEEPPIWPRTPPIRERQAIPTAWLELTISEGRNRQVRRMTAAVNHPTLRLIRAAIGPWSLGDLQPGEHRMDTLHLPQNAKSATGYPRQPSGKNTTRTPKSKREGR